jgi:hypothetical protein
VTSAPDRLVLARRIDGFADDAELRGNRERAAELRELAAAMRRKGVLRRRRRLPTALAANPDARQAQLAFDTEDMLKSPTRHVGIAVRVK